MLDSLESQVFSRVKYGFSDRIKKKYPDLNFTTNDRADTKPKFPTVYVHFMTGPESGSTTEGNDINAVYVNFQIDVTDNQSQARADEVARETLRVMKTMLFQAVGMPYHDNSDSAYRTVSRYRRMLADEDIL